MSLTLDTKTLTYLGYKDDDLVEFQCIQQIVELAVLLGFLELNDCELHGRDGQVEWVSLVSCCRGVGELLVGRIFIKRLGHDVIAVDIPCSSIVAGRGG